MATASLAATTSASAAALTSTVAVRAGRSGASASAFGGLSLAVAPTRSAARRAARVTMSAEGSESKHRVQDLVTPTSLALVAAAVLPEMAEAASPGVSPSLKNLLLSVLAGGSVLAVIGVGVAGLASFDPVSRK
ncbi:hypothetical protein CBR_g37553 [Chara braunii]|uniref:Uncharacterized protein n=1 Tax=Chara braunii TaxID=69332 RepID=A0A388LNG5_CHABU|nr:hypothetical protein CBR_g37553 [Chara braunii]|eukprot:GBG83752.1 hypothetical protein CBR_g37553 [Chara braunii]